MKYFFFTDSHSLYSVSVVKVTLNLCAQGLSCRKCTKNCKIIHTTWFFSHFVTKINTLTYFIEIVCTEYCIAEQKWLIVFKVSTNNLKSAACMYIFCISSCKSFVVCLQQQKETPHSSFKKKNRWRLLRLNGGHLWIYIFGLLSQIPN